MSQAESRFCLPVEKTENHCPIGETVGKKNMLEGKIPVYSCEGACIRGEIARQAANLVAGEDPYRRGCHGELFTVPGSAIFDWTRSAEKAVLIDGCFLRCHGRVMEDLIGKKKLIQFDALSFYKKYSDVFDIDGVPETERMRVAREVADWVLTSLGDPDISQTCGKGEQEADCGGCCG